MQRYNTLGKLVYSAGMHSALYVITSKYTNSIHCWELAHYVQLL